MLRNKKNTLHKPYQLPNTVKSARFPLALLSYSTSGAHSENFTISNIESPPDTFSFRLSTTIAFNNNSC